MADPRTGTGDEATADASDRAAAERAGEGSVDLGDPKADPTDEPESPEQELSSAGSP